MTLYLAENLKALRKQKDLTQEDAAEMLSVSPQSVSKWERGDTYPDITMLPALANLYKVSVDALIGMDRILDRQTRGNVFTTAHSHLRMGDHRAAIEVLTEALKVYPNDEGILSDLAMALALEGGQDQLARALALCERVLADNQGDKVHHTIRAALCFIYLKAAEKDKAIAVARRLPHLRESREVILAQIEKDLSADEINAYLKFIAIGEGDEQEIITVDFGIHMTAVCTEQDLLGRIQALREEADAPSSNDGHRKLPQIRVRDHRDIPPNQVRVRNYADYLLVKEYEDPAQAVADIIDTLRTIARDNAARAARG